MKNFVTPHCHVKSLDSASSPEKFAQRELDLGTGYLTVTDHGTLEATRQVYDLLRDKKAYSSIKPILGLEGYFRDDNCPILIENGAVRSADGTFRDALKYAHITLHTLDEAAYSTLSKVLSQADLRAEKHGMERKPLFTWANLEELGAQNVTATSGCLIGMIGRHLLANNDLDTAVKYYKKLRGTFKPGNFYVEIFPHVCDRDWKVKITVTDTNAFGAISAVIGSLYTELLFGMSMTSVFKMCPRSTVTSALVAPWNGLAIRIEAVSPTLKFVLSILRSMRLLFC